MKKVLVLIILLIVVVCAKATAAEAAYYTLTPTSGSFENGSDFSVVIGVDSQGVGIVAMDVVGSFDASKLQLDSIVKVEGSAVYNFLVFDNSASLLQIDNGAGTFSITLNPVGSSVYQGAVAAEGFLRLNFSAKAVGVASVSFTCSQGSFLDSNVLDENSADVLACSSNQSGSYTITAGSGGGAAATAIPTPTSSSVGGDATAATATPTQVAELPETGSVGSTVTLAVVGMMSVLGALVLKWF